MWTHREFIRMAGLLFCLHLFFGLGCCGAAWSGAWNGHTDAFADCAAVPQIVGPTASRQISALVHDGSWESLHAQLQQSDMSSSDYFEEVRQGLLNASLSTASYLLIAISNSDLAARGRFQQAGCLRKLYLSNSALLH